MTVIGAMIADYAHAVRRNNAPGSDGYRADIRRAYLNGAAHMITVAIMARDGVDEQTAAETAGEEINDYSLNRWG